MVVTASGFVQYYFHCYLDFLTFIIRFIKIIWSLTFSKSYGGSYNCYEVLLYFENIMYIERVVVVERSTTTTGAAVTSRSNDRSKRACTIETVTGQWNGGGGGGGDDARLLGGRAVGAHSIDCRSGRRRCLCPCPSQVWRVRAWRGRCAAGVSALRTLHRCPSPSPRSPKHTTHSPAHTVAVSVVPVPDRPPRRRRG